ncbi:MULTISPECIES: ubiquinone anaerobic biosynthesis accessory factor UbiT [Vibrio]|uniref:Ubiquinone biosynthesis accessory factor UbiT n=1 Tax=Vibrio algicola TaxID=2662262 RepID=A0A5Q0TEV0_9VIBR|nr:MULTISPECIES: SCP2 domain-containing protein [Vibrio]MBD1576110.1 SCP2 domain-containing protein [Vibrio sp. S11_S32]
MFSAIRSHMVANAARVLKKPVQFLPQRLQSKVLLEALQQVFHEALEDGDFEFLQDRWLKVEISDLNLSWMISFQDDKLIVSDGSQTEDASFSGCLNDLILIAGRKEDPDTLFFQRRLKIEGDTELGLEVKNLMDSIDLDSLPKPLTYALMQLAEFVQKGLQPQESQKQITTA